MVHTMKFEIGVRNKVIGQHKSSSCSWKIGEENLRFSRLSVGSLPSHHTSASTGISSPL